MTNVQAQSTDLFEENWQATGQAFRNTLQDNRVVGGALMFLEKDQLKGAEYYGFANLEQRRQVDEQTIFHWASITKTFTAIAIMQLRDRGLLSLGDPVIRYLPELGKVHNPYGSMDEITIRRVMSHSAGFRSPTWPWGGGKPWHPFEPSGWDQIVAMLPYTEVLFEPGSAYNYSNPAIIFLGKIIEQLTGDDYEVYVDKNILKPLGMHDSYFDTTPYHLQKHRSNSYSLRGDSLEPNGPDFDTGVTTSNGGLNAPLRDMRKYLMFLTGSFEGEAPLERSSLEEMWETQQPIAEDKGLRSSMGLSFFIEETEGLRLVGHTGTQHSYYSFFYVHPPSGAACIGVTNTSGRDGELDADQIRQDITRLVSRNLFSLYR